MSKKRTTLRSTAIAERKSPRGNTSANRHCIKPWCTHSRETYWADSRYVQYRRYDWKSRRVRSSRQCTTTVSEKYWQGADNGRPRRSEASLQQTTENEEETPFFTTYAHLVPTAKSLAPESEEDELSSSDEVVNKEFDKKEVLLGFSSSNVCSYEWSDIKITWETHERSQGETT